MWKLQTWYYYFYYYYTENMFVLFRSTRKETTRRLCLVCVEETTEASALSGLNFPQGRWVWNIKWLRIFSAWFFLNFCISHDHVTSISLSSSSLWNKNFSSPVCGFVCCLIKWKAEGSRDTLSVLLKCWWEIQTCVSIYQASTTESTPMVTHCRKILC